MRKVWTGSLFLFLSICSLFLISCKAEVAPPVQKTLKRIEIRGELTKIEYYVGDILSSNGIKVYAIYEKSDSTFYEENVSQYAEYQYEGFSSETEATNLEITIKCTYKGFTDEKKYHINVKSVFVPAERILLEDEFENSTFELGLKKTFTLVYTVFPYEASQEVIWESSRPDIMSVTKIDGKWVLQALKEGQTELTIKSATTPEIMRTCTVTAIRYPVESVTLNYDDIEIALGRTSRKLSVTVLPKIAIQDVIWTSSDENVLIVDSNTGVITTKGEGSAVVTVKSLDDPEKTASCNVSVRKIDVDSLSFITKEITVFVNDEETLSVSIKPSEASFPDVLWSSSDTDVVTVNENGVIKAKSAGSAAITATSVDNPQATDKCTITVITNNVETLSLDKEEISLLTGDEETLSAIVTPEDARYTAGIEWSSSDTDVVTVNENGVIKAKRAGTAVITATLIDNPEKMAECVVTVRSIENFEPQDYAVGDVILSDGTKVYYTDITEAQKAKAVAVVFGFSGNKALAAALECGSNLPWCTNTSPGYSIDFSELSASVNDRIEWYELKYEFTGNTNGSDDWEYICSVDPDGTENPATNYPAWNYVLNYGEAHGFDKFYKVGWYIPTLKEFYKLFENEDTVSNAILAAGGNVQFSQYNNYLTSCQNEYNSNYIYSWSYYYDLWSYYDYFDYDSNNYKSTALLILPIKEFPCSVTHYEDFESATISVSYPSYQTSMLSLAAETQNDGTINFTIRDSSSASSEETGTTYSWFLDTTLLDSSLVSDDGTELSLGRNFLSSLVSGMHVVTVLKRTPSGNYFDACCYVDITYGQQNSFVPDGSTVCIVLPIYSGSTLNISSEFSMGGAYTFTASDTDITRNYTKYTWFLDTDMLTESTATLRLDAEQIDALSVGAHTVSVIAYTSSGEVYDAACYIRRNEKATDPKGIPISIVFPVFHISNVTIDVCASTDGAYTFTTSDTDITRNYTRYTWFLDTDMLTESTATLRLDAEQIDALSVGAHAITVLAYTSSGEVFDATCYIKRNED